MIDKPEIEVESNSHLWEPEAAEVYYGGRHMTKEDTVTITKEEYDDLLAERKWLACLEAAGVDNWEGISFAYELLGEEAEDW